MIISTVKRTDEIPARLNRVFAAETPARLNLERTSTQPTGERLLGFVFKRALANGAEKLWLLASDEKFSALEDASSGWRQIVSKKTFHSQEILETLGRFASNGRVTIVLDGLASVWGVSSSKVELGEEIFLRRLAV